MKRKNHEIRCRRLKTVEGTLIDRALTLHERGKMEDFWDAITALNELTEVRIRARSARAIARPQGAVRRPSPSTRLCETATLPAGS